jgi:hypothetical protein
MTPRQQPTSFCGPSGRTAVALNCTLCPTANGANHPLTFTELWPDGGDGALGEPPLPPHLNVSISRAQALAVVIYNPDLLRVQCRTPEQIRLANSLCRVVESADLAARETSTGVSGIPLSSTRVLETFWTRSELGAGRSRYSKNRSESRAPCSTRSTSI